jgi:hypothetical protein
MTPLAIDMEVRMRRLFCKLFGHRWALHPYYRDEGSIETGAGSPLKMCQRCGEA